jgi:hypothetical protein
MSILWQTSEVNALADVGSCVLKFHGLMSTTTTKEHPGPPFASVLNLGSQLRAVCW